MILDWEVCLGGAGGLAVKIAASWSGHPKGLNADTVVLQWWEPRTTSVSVPVFFQEVAHSIVCTKNQHLLLK